MPMIPRYDAPTVENAPLVNPQMPTLGPEAFGAGLGAGISKASGVLFDIAQKEQEKADNLAINNAQTELLSGAGKIKVDTLAKMGTDATAPVDTDGNKLPTADVKALQDYDALSSKIRAGLSDRQKAVFDAKAASHRLDLEHAAYGHVVGQREAVYNQSLDALIAEKHNAAALATTGEQRTKAFDDLQETLDERYRNQSEEAYNVARDQHLSTLTAGWILDQSKLNPALGKQDLDQALKDGDILKVDYDRVVEHVRNISSADAADKAVLDIYSRKGPAAMLATDKDNKFRGVIANIAAPLQEMVAEAEKITDPVVRKMTIEGLHSKVSDFEHQNAMQQHSLHGSVMNQLYSGKDNAADLKAIPAIIASDDFNALSGDNQSNVRKTMDMEIKQDAARRKGLLTEFKAEQRQNQADFYATVTPEMLANMSDSDLRSWLPKVGMTTYNAIVKTKKTYESNLQTLDKAKADTKVVTDVATLAGWGKSGLENPAKFGRLLQSVTEAIQNEGVETKKPVPQERVRDIATGMLRDIVIDPGTIWDTKAPAYTMFNRNAQNYTIPGASSEQVAHVVSVLRQYGNKNPSLDDVVNGIQQLRKKRK